jgi:hypothetical protein
VLALDVVLAAAAADDGRAGAEVVQEALEVRAARLGGSARDEGAAEGERGRFGGDFGHRRRRHREVTAEGTHGPDRRRTAADGCSFRPPPKMERPDLEGARASRRGAGGV